MSIIKYADDIHFGLDEVYDPVKIASNPGLSILLTQPENADIDEETKQRFVKFAANLKRVAPKANDFLYFSAVMLHSAEAAIIDQTTGEIKKDRSGNPVTAEWEINKKGSWKWKCSDPNIRPYKNNNGDIFPEAELKKAYRKWIGRPLCKDHQSSSVDGIRGIIVDTFYDDRHKRVVGLCALDKINYPDLARKVSTGYAHDVSMGTAVGRSICFECGNIATVEAEYCPCVKTRRTYGEINVDLNPIELSLVVTGADPGAKLRSIIASLNKYSEEKEERINELKKAGCVTPGELERLEKEVEDLRKTVATVLETKITKEAVDMDKANIIRNLSESLKNITNPETKKKIEGAIADLTNEVSAAADAVVVEPPYGMAGRKEMTSGHAESATQDLKSGGPTDINNPTGFDTRLAGDSLLNQINSKLDAMEHALRDISKGVQGAKTQEEQAMSNKLRERAAARRAMFQKSAYYQGGGGLNEPQTYPKDPMGDNVRDKEDKQMVGMYLDENPENLGGGKEELNLKQKLSRAELEERKLKRHALLKTQELESFKTKNGKVITFDASTGETKVSDASDLDMEEVFGKKAYFQGGGGVNEPQTYPKDPMGDNVRDKEDKQMVGMYLDENPEDLGGGKEELSLKQKLLRADEKMRARFVLAFKNDEKTVLDKENSYWKILAGTEKNFNYGTERELLRANGSEVYEDELEDNWEVFASKEWGRKVLSTIKEDGFAKVAWMLKGDGFTKTAQPPMPPMPPMDMGAPAPEAAPLPPAPEGEKESSKDPVDEAVDSLTKSLEDSEKFLGDLKDALQKSTGETDSKLPSPAEADDKGEDACEKCGKCPCVCEEEDEEKEEKDADDAAAEVAEKVQEVYAALDESADELAMLAESLESRKRAGKTKKDVVTAELLRLTKDALTSNATISKEAALIIDAAKKKEKKEEEEEEEPKKGKKEKKEKEEEPKKGKKEKKEEEEEPKKGKKEKKEKKDEEEEDEPKKGKKSKAEVLLENILNARAAKRREMVRVADDLDIEVGGDDMAALKAENEMLKKELSELKSEEKSEILSGKEPKGAHPGLEEELGMEVSEDDDYEMDLDDELSALLKETEEEPTAPEEGTEGAAELKTAAERKAWREAIAAEVGSKYQLKLDPETTVDTDMPLMPTYKLEQLDTKTDEATVEGIVDMHEEIMKQVKTLPKVREAMEHLGNMLKSGQLKVSELEDEAKLLALAVDPAAAKYWKDYFGQGDKDCKAFGVELVKEFVAKKAEQNVEDQKLRLKRAFDLALDMQDRGIIEEGRGILLKQADDLAKLSDEQFESLKKVVARANKKMNKTAAQNPALNVGVNNSEELGEGADSPDLVNALSRMWDK